MLAHLARFGLNLAPLKDQNKSAAAGEILRLFGSASPIQTLLDQKILKIELDEALNGQREEVFRLGDAETGERATLTFQTAMRSSKTSSVTPGCRAPCD